MAGLTEVYCTSAPASSLVNSIRSESLTFNESIDVGTGLNSGIFRAGPSFFLDIASAICL